MSAFAKGFPLPSYWVPILLYTRPLAGAFTVDPTRARHAGCRRVPPARHPQNRPLYVGSQWTYNETTLPGTFLARTRYTVSAASVMNSSSSPSWKCCTKALGKRMKGVNDCLFIIRFAQVKALFATHHGQW